MMSNPDRTFRRGGSEMGAKRLVDLSIPIEGDLPSDPPMMIPPVSTMWIVPIQTGADAAWGTEKYLVTGAGMDRESTLFLTEQGIRVTGIDAWSWDRPLPYLAEEFKRTGDPSVIWEAHFAGIDLAIATWKRWPISALSGDPLDSRSAVSPSTSRGPARDGCAR